ncbi:DUF5672 family protein [Algoriphagus confluentis]|uniref:DUF5672 domain-containing protein n=1 Tax=Algoriphagus confluentis TaxID=1697556 RepID=A0ABQ6PP95_9BACT|nr:hypothetical protein Aconfl_22110 [Algoriphagus confluentis]
MNTVVILIIVHKKIPTFFEKMSLIQCLNILGSHPIKLVCPIGLDVSEYLEVNKDLEFDFINPNWHSNYTMFNRLKISPFLYERYRDYNYIMFYELDSWVFRDELLYWCSKGYDYIGAPWIGLNVYSWLYMKNIYPFELKLIWKFLDKSKINIVGNGGFSLRKTKSMLINSKLFSFRGRNWDSNEDSFFCHYVSSFNKFFKVADFPNALKFSFDVSPDKSYQLNNFELPFGCHGFSRSDLPNYVNNFEFWRDHISELNL